MMRCDTSTPGRHLSMFDNMRTKTPKDRPVLPICKRCKTRKTRCDRAAPRCGACLKANASCIIVDALSNKEYSREHVHCLEERERYLLAKIRHRRQSSSASVSTCIASQTRTPTPGTTSSPTGQLPSFVADPDAIAFGSLASRAGHTSPALHDAENNHRPGSRGSPEKQRPHRLPPRQEATKLLDTYFDRFHIHHTFLLRQDVLDTFRRIYEPSSQSKATFIDHFRILMIFAISAITRYRNGLCATHPYGYYLAAQQYLDFVPLLGSIDAIENLLLVTRFGMYHRCDVSLWEVSQLCMRQCIEWHLHEPVKGQMDLIEEQRRRRIFWECYLLDRNSAGFHGRPFAISEVEIQVELPVVADDESLVRSGALSLASVSDSLPTSPTELSVFVFFIRLRRITSRIHVEFYVGRQSDSHGHGRGCYSAMQVYEKVNEIQKELDRWRQDAPVFQFPKSLYERPEWYEYLLQRDRLAMIRGAIHNMPKGDGKSPPKDLLATCLDAATRVINIFFALLKKNDITWTKGYLQSTFTAGLTVLYCMSLDAHTLAGGVGAQGPREALSLYGEILRLFKEQMPDTLDFNVFFRAIRDKFLADRGPSNSHLEIFGPMYSESRGETRSAPARTDNEFSGKHRAGGGTGLETGSAPEIPAGGPGPDASLACDVLFPDLEMNFDNSDLFALSDGVLNNLDSDLVYQAWAAPPDDLFEWTDYLGGQL